MHLQQSFAQKKVRLSLHSTTHVLILNSLFKHLAMGKRYVDVRENVSNKKENTTPHGRLKSSLFLPDHTNHGSDMADIDNGGLHTVMQLISLLDIQYIESEI